MKHNGRQLRIVLHDMEERVKGRYIPKSLGEYGTLIQINDRLGKNDLLQVIRHELKHYVLDMHDVKGYDSQEKIITVLEKEREWIERTAHEYDKRFRRELDRRQHKNKHTTQEG